MVNLFQDMTTGQLTQFNGVTIQTLNDCPHRTFIAGLSVSSKFCASCLVQFRGTVIKCLTDFVSGTTIKSYDSS